MNQNQRYCKQSKSQDRRERWHATLDPIHIPYGQLLSYLIQSLLVVPKSLGSARTPYPPGYDPNAQCEYHKWLIGHFVEDYWSFKGKFQELINNKRLVFEEANMNVKYRYHTGTMGHMLSTNAKSFRVSCIS